MARTPWRIHLWGWDLAERCFSSLCEMVKKFELKKFELKKKFENFFFRSEHTSSQIWCFLKFPLCWGGGGSKNQSWSEWHETWSHFGIFEIQWNFQNGGGGSKNQSCSEWRETWSCFGIFEIRWNFRNLVRKVNRATSKQARQHTSGHHSDQISRSALRDGATKKDF